MSRIIKAGGKPVIPKIEVPSVGWVAYFADPDGNTHGIVQLEEAAESGLAELQVERIFKAPRKLVWQHWSVPELLTKWWGPKDFTSPEAKIDFREGGKYLFAMRSPEGQDFYSTGVYKEIVPLEKIVATDSFADKEGNIVPSSYYGMGGSSLDEYYITLLFEEIGQKTKMTLKHLGLPTDIINMTKHGWEESFDKLDESLKV
ncbi:ATPase [Candidatus Falkowbacteria bacterium HGW-Falkowbacteria-2]|uniref:ATPase n=1 Tax=Candidatus Falkowbacteria bacterium HGW-Falkowbacteria-2 TaxID=2013769 RepID=A0A2N2E1D3_9BACT|nr:MAG: ATPase [Candidatus Falkowbacteria bacterium HGW-Falkowbacteria-2]